jgi:membrane associated rhomboid family serine protease/Flp pilus assembly protein TadD
MANCVQCGRKLPPLTFGKKICQWCVQHEAAQRGELNDDASQPAMAVPWTRGESSIGVTQLIFGVNVAIFLAMMLAMWRTTGTVSMDFSGELQVYFGANYTPRTLSGEWWRLITYMFIHGGVIHIAMNMWCLWNLGSLCESLYGRWTYAAIYLITGVAGGLASLAWHPVVLSVGASGAIFGLFGALIASFALGEFQLGSVAVKPILSSLLFWAGFSLFFGSIEPSIDNACHFGGLVSGLILGALIARVAPDSRNLVQRLGVLLFVALLVLTSAVGVQRWRGRELGLEESARAGRSSQERIANLQEKIKQNPNNAPAHYALAHAYFSNGQMPEGERELQRVLELDPQNAEARMDLGALYLNQNEAAKAEEQFSKLTTLQPGNARAHAGLGIALGDEQKNEAAVLEYQTALRLDPQLKGIYYLLGESELELKRYDDALASLLKGRETNDDAALENALASAYEAKGMTQQAKDARNRADQLKKDGSGH